MKKQTVSFQFDTTPAPFRPLRLTDAAAGVLLLAGIWGLLWQCLRPESVPGLLGLGAHGDLAEDELGQAGQNGDQDLCQIIF